MDAVGASQPHSGYLDLSWSKPAVKLLLITGVALAVLGALVLVGVNYPVGLLAVLANTFKPVGAGFMMGTGLTTFLFTAIATLLVKPIDQKEPSKKTPTSVEEPVARPRPSERPSSKPGDAPPNLYGYRPEPEPQPVPQPTGSRGSAQDHQNVRIE